MEAKGEPVPVKVHDFKDPQLGKANPYGVYDVTADTGWVSVGTDHDTSAFAVNTIRSWWSTVGTATYPAARRLLITADGGGSNGYRTRLWKTELAAFAAEAGQITACHLPPGTSKWNKIEHRLFSRISINWRSRPLTSHDVIVNTIAGTTTASGTPVAAVLDTASTPRESRSPTSRFAPSKTRNPRPPRLARRMELHPPPDTQQLIHSRPLSALAARSRARAARAFVGDGVGGGDGLVAGLDGDGAAGS